MIRRTTRWALFVLTAVSVLLWGCGASGEPAQVTPEAGSGSADFPVKDPGEPFAVDEKGTVTLTNEQAYEITVRRDSGEPLYVFIAKKGVVVDPQVNVAIETIQPELPADLAESYVPMTPYAFHMHAVDDTGYAFMLRPQIQAFYTDQEIAAAKEAGAALDTLAGNLLILYKEQRSPKWVPQTGVSLDQGAKMVTASNLAATGAWWLVAKK